MVGAAAPGPGAGQIGLDGDMEFGGGTALAHLVDMDAGAGAIGRAVFAHRAHVHDLGEDGVGRLQVGDAQRDRAEAADLMLGRHRTLLPRMGLAGAAVVDEREALAFRILEEDRGAAVARLDAAVGDTGVGETLLPPGKARLAADTERRARDRIGAATLGRGRPVEEGHVGAGGAELVGVEEMIGGDVVLVHGLLDQAQAELARVEIDVALGVGGDGASGCWGAASSCGSRLPARRCAGRRRW